MVRVAASVQPSQALRAGSRDSKINQAPGAKVAANGGQRREPIGVRQEDLRDVGGHRCRIERHPRPDGGGVAINPRHAVGAGLLARHVKRRARRVNASDAHAASREEERKDARAAPEIEDGTHSELFEHGDVGIKVRPVRL